MFDYGLFYKIIYIVLQYSTINNNKLRPTVFSTKAPLHNSNTISYQYLIHNYLNQNTILNSCNFQIKKWFFFIKKFPIFAL